MKQVWKHDANCCITWSSVMEKRLCGSVVIHTLKVSWGDSTVVTVSSSSSINSRPRWQFCKRTQPPCSHSPQTIVSYIITEQSLLPPTNDTHLRNWCLDKFPCMHLLSLSHWNRPAVCGHRDAIGMLDMNFFLLAQTKKKPRVKTWSTESYRVQGFWQVPLFDPWDLSPWTGNK